jgi:phosphoribosylanthranilate isomerase
MIVKICGITCIEDALMCAAAGADMLGFNFYPPSPRFIEVERCAEMVAEVRRLYPYICHVGVFVNEQPATVHTILTACNLDLAQCSGNETPGTIHRTGDRSFKALRPSSPNDLRSAAGLYPTRSQPPAFLIDALHKEEYGGTGQTANWALAAAFAANLPILLAGGLTPENITQAVRWVQPWGVDVASGVESTPGRKDRALVEKFISAARAEAARTESVKNV